MRPAALAFALLITSCSGPESFGNKTEWSILQGVEYKHRNTPVSSPVTLEQSTYRIAGLPRTDGPGAVWVLLNPQHDPFYKQIPEGSYRLSAVELAELKVTNPAVLAELQAHVRE